MLRYETETRPDLVALYDIQPGNGAGQFLQPRSPHGAKCNKGKGTYTWYSASSWIITSEALRYGMCSHEISPVLPAHPHIHLQLEWAIPAFAFTATAGTHLPTPEGWKAELAWMAGYVVRMFTCPKADTHPTTNWARCRATALIETNTLLLH